MHRLILTLILMVYDLRLTLRLMVHRWRVLRSFVDINKQYNPFDALYWSKPQDAVAADHRAFAAWHRLLLYATSLCLHATGVAVSYCVVAVPHCAAADDRNPWKIQQFRLVVIAQDDTT